MPNRHDLAAGDDDRLELHGFRAGVDAGLRGQIGFRGQIGLGLGQGVRERLRLLHHRAHDRPLVDLDLGRVGAHFGPRVVGVEQRPRGYGGDGHGDLGGLGLHLDAAKKPPMPPMMPSRWRTTMAASPSSARIFGRSSSSERPR